MSELIRSLSRLGQVVGNLEGSVEYLEGSLSGEQRDMFSAIPPANANTSSIDKEVVTQKLDLAIEKIEEILEEGEVANG